MQFLVAGFLLFVGYHALHSELGDRQVGRIELTADDVDQLRIASMAQWQRPPTAEELRNLITDKVREEILYREALALGLDRNDTIVKRRLAQKMEFLSEDVAAARAPTREELERWYASHPETFVTPTVVSFQHLYFSTDRRGERAEVDAAATLATLRREPAAPASSDPFMFQDSYAERSRDQIASVFGTAFAAAVFRLPPSAWQGPIESGLGWHLVRVDAVVPGRVPALDEIRDAAVEAWTSEQRTVAKRAAFAEMRARYEVVLPPEFANGVEP